MLNFTEFVTEKLEPGRAWNGKIKNIDNLLSWMYDNDILTKKDKKKKDSLFRQYYRYYNDGDFPRGVGKKAGISSYSNSSVIAMELEVQITAFIKEILSKYSGKYDRTQFRYSQLLSELYTIQSVLSSYDSQSLLSYWSKKTKVDDDKFQELLVKLESITNELLAEIKSINKEGGMTISYYRREMTNSKTWSPKCESLYDEMTDIMISMHKIINKVIEGVQKLKSELGDS